MSRALGRADATAGFKHRKGVDMANKSPRKAVSKKSGKTLNEKRRDKKDKQQVRMGLNI